MKIVNQFYLDKIIYTFLKNLILFGYRIHKYVQKR